MDKVEITKIIGAVVVAVVIMCASAIIGKAYYQKGDVPEKSAYKIEIIEKTASANNIKSNKLASAIKEVKIDIISLISSGDIEKGRKIAKKKCASCHKFEASKGNSTGPNLFGVAGRNKAEIEGFKYSKSMQEKEGKWDDESLFKFLTKPKLFIPKTKMSFAGLKKNKDTADVISYLKTLK